ncbi:MAG: RebB family R body protein [Chitinophagaceae bacterium]
MYSLQATFTTMAVSIGIAMQNASTNQHNGQNIANACLSMCCKMILTKGASA